ncbi:MAG: FHA domain-containing protein [Planctomycetes bacterium]|nr:FHA domain-containing protein [Planctomycetota bacterium]
MAKLYVERGSLRGRELILAEGKACTVGRSSSCALSLSDHLTSREHFRVIAKGGRYFVEDLGSSNGTFVNGAQITKVSELKLGDQIEAGDTLVSLLADDERRTTGGLVGREIAGYQILERVGRGGMGTVYRARQVSLDRIVAFKVLSPNLAGDQEFIQRFTDEVRAAASLAHPNIARALDVGQDDATHYFVMEFMAGGSFDDRIEKEGRIAPDRAVPMLLDIARGLAYAEERGIVHRDIKPENLMVDEQGVGKIVDLGIACERKGKSRADQSEGVFGSAHYIAPEQASGEKIDSRADIYGLGATAYHMLTGRTMFTGESQEEIMAKHVDEAPEPIEKVAPWVPRSLCAVVTRMVAKDPDERYGSARELIEALESLGAGAVAGVRPIELRHVDRLRGTSGTSRTDRLKRERRTKFIIAGVIGGLLLLVALVFLLTRL